MGSKVLFWTDKIDADVNKMGNNVLLVKIYAAFTCLNQNGIAFFIIVIPLGVSTFLVSYIYIWF